MSYENSECMDDLVTVVETQSQMEAIENSVREKCMESFSMTSSRTDRSLRYITAGLAVFTMYSYENMPWPTYIPVQLTALLFVTYHITSMRSVIPGCFTRDIEEINSLRNHVDAILPRALEHYKYHVEETGMECEPSDID
jgi:hypothetical protein